MTWSSFDFATEVRNRLRSAKVIASESAPTLCCRTSHLTNFELLDVPCQSVPILRSGRPASSVAPYWAAEKASCFSILPKRDCTRSQFHCRLRAAVQRRPQSRLHLSSQGQSKQTPALAVAKAQSSTRFPNFRWEGGRAAPTKSAAMDSIDDSEDACRLVVNSHFDSGNIEVCQQQSCSAA